MEQENNSNKTSDNYTHIIRIPSLDDSYTFARNRYDSEILNDYILKTDFDKIINKASRIFGDSILKKRANDTFFISRKSNKLTIISLICIFLFILFFYLSQIGKSSLVMFIFAAFFCCLGLIINLFQTYSSFFVRENRKYKTVEEIINEDMNQYLKNVNNNLSFQNINGSLKFSYNPEDRSIECKVYKSQNEGIEDDRNIFSSESSNNASKESKNNSDKNNVISSGSNSISPHEIEMSENSGMSNKKENK